MSQHTNVGLSIGRHLALIATSIFMLAPFVWMLSLSLKPSGEIFQQGFSLIPQQFFGRENYSDALNKVPIIRFMWNGVVVCAGILIAQIIVAVPCAYALAKLEFPGRKILFALVLIGLLIPPQVLAVPIFILLYSVGLLDSYAALILPWTILVFGIFLLRQFFRTIPDDLIHAARLDGFSEFAIVWQIMVPLAAPALVAFGIFSVVSHWNDLFWPLIVVQSEDLATPPLGVMHFRNAESGNDYGPLMAGVTIITAPLLLAFLLAQRWFIEGIALTGMK